MKRVAIIIAIAIVCFGSGQSKLRVDPTELNRLVKIKLPTGEICSGILMAHDVVATAYGCLRDLDRNTVKDVIVNPGHPAYWKQAKGEFLCHGTGILGEKVSFLHLSEPEDQAMTELWLSSYDEHSDGILFGFGGRGSFLPFGHTYEVKRKECGHESEENADNACFEAPKYCVDDLGAPIVKRAKDEKGFVLLGIAHGFSIRPGASCRDNGIPTLVRSLNFAKPAIFNTLMAQTTTCSNWASRHQTTEKPDAE